VGLKVEASPIHFILVSRLTKLFSSFLVPKLKTGHSWTGKKGFSFSVKGNIIIPYCSSESAVKWMFPLACAPVWSVPLYRWHCRRNRTSFKYH